MPMPAAMTVKGPIQLPVGAPSAASANPGHARTTTATRMSERRTSNLLCTCDLLVMRTMRVMRAVLRFGDGSRNVQHREHDEDEPLKERDQDLQRIQESDREDHRHESADAADDN